jgi:hypothetical protein
MAAAGHFQTAWGSIRESASPGHWSDEHAPSQRRRGTVEMPDEEAKSFLRDGWVRVSDDVELRQTRDYAYDLCFCLTATPSFSNSSRQRASMQIVNI